MTGSGLIARLSTGGNRIKGSLPIRVASWLFLGNGVAWGLGTIPYAMYINSLGRLPVFGSIRANAGPVSDHFGWEGVVWLLIPMGLLAWVEVLAGWWLRKPEKQGGWLAIVSFPVWMFFPVGFLLPIWIALGPIRVALVLTGWKALR